MNKESRIFIAGHAGLVGSAIVRKLNAMGCQNLILKSHETLDLRRQKDTELFFEKEKPEFVFLAAAKVGGILANSLYKAEFIYDNVMIAANVIQSSWKYGVKKMVNLGSSCIYPKMAPQPLKEEYLLSGYLEPSNDAYAMAKITAIKMCNAYNDQYGTNFISAMPTNLYGPGDNFNLETSHVLPALIRKMHLGKCLENNDFELIRKDFNSYPIEGIDGNSTEESIIGKMAKYGIVKTAEEGVVINLWGDGTPYREFLFSEDLAEAVIFLMNNVESSHLANGFINIGSGVDQTIAELAEIVKNLVGFNGTVKWDKEKPNGTPKKLLDVSLLNKFGWQYRTSLNEGIKEIYYNYNNI